MHIYMCGCICGTNIMYTYVCAGVFACMCAWYVCVPGMYVCTYVPSICAYVALYTCKG